MCCVVVYGRAVLTVILLVFTLLLLLRYLCVSYCVVPIACLNVCSYVRIVVRIGSIIVVRIVCIAVFWCCRSSCCYYWCHADVLRVFSVCIGVVLLLLVRIPVNYYKLTCITTTSYIIL